MMNEILISCKAWLYWIADRTITRGGIVVATVEEGQEKLGSAIVSTMNCLNRFRNVEDIKKAIKQIEELPLGYKTENEHKLLENYADRVVAILKPLTLQKVKPDETT